jgi:hypothetical protein
MSDLVLVCFERVLVSVQDRCMVCAKRTIGSEIVLDAPMVLLDAEAQVEACFCPLEIVLILTQVGRIICAEPNIGSKIVLDGPNGTPR